MIHLGRREQGALAQRCPTENQASLRSNATASENAQRTDDTAAKNLLARFAADLLGKYFFFKIRSAPKTAHDPVHPRRRKPSPSWDSELPVSPLRHHRDCALAASTCNLNAT
jgi:hypothetical protein